MHVHADMPGKESHTALSILPGSGVSNFASNNKHSPDINEVALKKAAPQGELCHYLMKQWRE